MAAAHDTGGSHRTAQARIRGRPRTDRWGRFDLPRRRPRYGRRRSLRRPVGSGRGPRPRGQAEGETSGVIGMARKPVASRRPARQPAKTTPEASLPLDASVLSIVAGLEGHDLNGLRRQWRAHLGGEPPAHLPRWLLMRVLAYRLQADAFGGLDKSIQRMLRSEQGAGHRRSLRPAGASDPGRRWPEGRRAAGARVEGQARAGHDPRGRLRLERPDLWQPVPDRQGDDRNQLERSSLLRASAGKDRQRG